MAPVRRHRAIRRDHAWGGDNLENRMRFPVSIAEAIRNLLPDSMPLFYRNSSVGGIDGGVTIEDSIVLARGS